MAAMLREHSTLCPRLFSRGAPMPPHPPKLTRGPACTWVISINLDLCLCSLMRSESPCLMRRAYAFHLCGFVSVQFFFFFFFKRARRHVHMGPRVNLGRPDGPTVTAPTGGGEGGTVGDISLLSLHTPFFFFFFSPSFASRADFHSPAVFGAFALLPCQSIIQIQRDLEGLTQSIFGVADWFIFNFP